ncbi:hypothetical protein KO525_16535 [Psychrosphaera sp. B3R10]|uniref:hypothetical protein n=1 Tax=unclassified Psychrosphaera TaxID=2641570 RepID=UPI001C088C34|nr:MULTISPECIES: hypothetical protein [unclassified Psychrosphaera]MBU2883645.1 hypothetical protein [Psychrosphaera sp. I2R16]MBU2990995.1 hypothetical protein [Psychrosphaera sp. B3R10]
MKSMSNVLVFTLFCLSCNSIAEESIPDTEPTKCYQMAFGSKVNRGLGFTAGQAAELCSGATDAKRVILCAVKAWSHPDNDGLGLTAGLTVTLCKDGTRSNIH